MMEGKIFTEQELLEAIYEHFGKEETFCTCHDSDLSAPQLIDFLKSKGKIKLQGDKYVVDPTMYCHH